MIINYGTWTGNVRQFVFGWSTVRLRDAMLRRCELCNWTLRYMQTINATAETITSYESVRHVHAHYSVDRECIQLPCWLPNWQVLGICKYKINQVNSA